MATASQKKAPELITLYTITTKDGENNISSQYSHFSTICRPAGLPNALANTGCTDDLQLGSADRNHTLLITTMRKPVTTERSAPTYYSMLARCVGARTPCTQKGEVAVCGMQTQVHGLTDMGTYGGGGLEDMETWRHGHSRVPTANYLSPVHRPSTRPVPSLPSQ